MRKSLVFLLLLVGTSLTLTAQETDSASVKVHPSVAEYLESICTEPIDTIIARTDSLIETTAPLGVSVQSDVAGLAFDFFNTSRVMGVEGVSVHIAEKYFINGPLVWKDSSSFHRMEEFVRMNRSSLVECQAPELEMENIDGSLVSLRKDDGTFKVLLFYEPECSSCEKTMPPLVQVLNRYKGSPVTLFAVNTGVDRSAWEEYIIKHFSMIDNSNVKVVNLWDPEVSSSYHIKYGVMKTPMMFLMDSQNRIIGRKLDAVALVSMLRIENSTFREYRKLYGEIFDAAAPKYPEDLEEVVDAVVSRAESDSSFFREVVYNMFNYLRNAHSRIMQEGAIYVAETYIIGEPWYWSEEYVEQVHRLLEKARLNPLNSRISNLLLQNDKGKYATLHGECANTYTLIVFHLIDCKECSAWTEKLTEMSKTLFMNGIRVVLVYTGHDEALWKKFIAGHPKKWRYLRDSTGESRMHELFDLEFVPHSFLVDSDHIVLAKDVTPETIKEIIPYL